MKVLYTFLISCFCVGFSLAQSDIASLEYFFDTDPGVGLANAIDINPDAETINQSFNISTSGLTVGTHRLFIRAINADGDVSLYEHKTFRIAPVSENNSADIVEAEYFIDQDPGIGNATFIDVVDGEVVDEALTVPTGSLSLGTHRLFIRVKNSDNQWSLYDHKTFRIAPASDVNNSSITAAEYFIDADPGVGLATALTVSGDSLDEDLVIPTSTGLAQGDHYLHIRVLNADGTWSLYERLLFTLDGTLGINTEVLAEIKLFPNPTSDYINISIPNGNTISSTVIYNINGKQVYKNNSHLEKINISNLSNGTYLLILETEKGSISKKIIKN